MTRTCDTPSVSVTNHEVDSGSLKQATIPWIRRVSDTSTEVNNAIPTSNDTWHVSEDGMTQRCSRMMRVPQGTERGVIVSPPASQQRTDHPATARAACSGSMRKDMRAALAWSLRLGSGCPGCRRTGKHGHACLANPAHPSGGPDAPCTQGTAPHGRTFASPAVATAGRGDHHRRVDPARSLLLRLRDQWHHHRGGNETLSSGVGDHVQRTERGRARRLLSYRSLVPRVFCLSQHARTDYGTALYHGHMCWSLAWPSVDCGHAERKPHTPFPITSRNRRRARRCVGCSHVVMVWNGCRCVQISVRPSLVLRMQPIHLVVLMVIGTADERISAVSS